MLTEQGGAGDGIRVSCEVRNESVDVQHKRDPTKRHVDRVVFPYVVILKDTCRNTEREGEERDLEGFI